MWKFKSIYCHPAGSIACVQASQIAVNSPVGLCCRVWMRLVTGEITKGCALSTESSTLDEGWLWVDCRRTGRIGGNSCRSVAHQDAGRCHAATRAKRNYKNVMDALIRCVQHSHGGVVSISCSKRSHGHCWAASKFAASGVPGRGPIPSLVSSVWNSMSPFVWEAALISGAHYFLQKFEPGYYLRV